MSFLTLVVALMLVIKRFAAVSQRRVNPKFYKLYREGQEPEDVAVYNRHLINLFEQPVLFYTVIVMAYATGLYFIDMDRLVEEAVDEALGYAEQGFRAIKMKIGLGDPALDHRRVDDLALAGMARLQQRATALITASCRSCPPLRGAWGMKGQPRACWMLRPI